MRKIFSVLLAALLAAGTMILPAAADDGDIVYLQTFDDVASFDDLGWEIVETLTTNTTTYTVENGALTVDNLGGNDSYVVVVPASVMDEVNQGDYTVGYDFTMTEAGDTARYLAMLLNYDREMGNTYNSLHLRMKGCADWQNRFVGTWSSNLDSTTGYNGLSTFNAQDDGAISNRLFGLAFDAGSNVVAGKTIRYEMRVSNSGQYCEVYMNGELISGTDEAGWDQFTWASEDYSEICLKSGGSIYGYVDNIVVAKGLGIPEGTLPEMSEAAATATAATTETASTESSLIDTSLQNLALGATVTVSGVENDNMGGELAVDGDLTTRWASDYNDNASIIIDIGSPLPVGYLELYWETASAQDYTVETSSDGTTYTTVATVTGNTAGSSPASEEGKVVHEWTATTARFIKINCTKRNTEYGNSLWEVVARKAADTVDVDLPANYPSSGTEIPDGSVLINGDRIGTETGWGSNSATGRDAAFDGDVNTFFDPPTASVDYAGIDAGEEMILTKILIHPRDGQLARFNGATIEAANEEDFSDAVALYFSVEEASEFAWYDVTDEIESADNTGYRYFRYINYTSHGDVAEVELYGYAVDGTNPTYGAATVEETPAVEETPVVEETPAAEEEAVEAPADEEVTEEVPADEEEVVEAPATVETEEETVEEAAQTFDFGVIAAVAAIISAAGYAISKKR